MTLLDAVLPVYDFNERHRIRVPAPAERVLDIVKRITPNDTTVFRWLMGLRYLPALLTERRPIMAREQPLLDQFVAAGFVVLAESAAEFVVGSVGQFWKLRRGPKPAVRSVEEFMAFNRTGYAKVAVNFRVVEGPTGTDLNTETRILATDPLTRRRFAWYWVVIRLGSGAIRRSWLRAVRRSALLRASRRPR